MSSVILMNNGRSHIISEPFVITDLGGTTAVLFTPQPSSDIRRLKEGRLYIPLAFEECAKIVAQSTNGVIDLRPAQTASDERNGRANPSPV